MAEQGMEPLSVCPAGVVWLGVRLQCDLPVCHWLDGPAEHEDHEHGVSWWVRLDGRLDVDATSWRRRG